MYAYAKGMVDALNLKAGDKVALWMANETENVRALFLLLRATPLLSHFGMLLLKSLGSSQFVIQLACALIGVKTINIDVSLGFPAVL